MRECCRGDDQSQWRSANLDPPPRLNPLTDPHQNLHRWLCRGYLPPRRILFRSDKGFRFRACATSRTIVYLAIFLGVLEITYSQDATTDIDAKYVKRRVSAQGCAFWGSQNQTLTSTPPFPLNPPMPKEGVRTTPSCGLLWIIFLSCAHTTDNFCVSVPKHQRHFLTYYTPLYPRQVRFVRLGSWNISDNTDESTGVVV